MLSDRIYRDKIALVVIGTVNAEKLDLAPIVFDVALPIFVMRSTR
jgi:hypothetical protein